MDHHKTSHKINIEYGRVAPTVAVSDMAKAIDFYTHVLGLEKTFENGTPIGFAIFKRGATEIHLTLAKNHVSTDRNVAHILVGDAKTFHDHLIQAGVRIIKGLREAQPGLLGFVFADPDGNRFDVGQKINYQNLGDAK